MNLTLIPLSEIADLLPRQKSSGRRVSIATLYRWHQTGKNGVRLRCYDTNRGLATTERDLLEFLRLSAEARRYRHGSRRPAPPPQENKADRERVSRARAELAELLG